MNADPCVWEGLLGTETLSHSVSNATGPYPYYEVEGVLALQIKALDSKHPAFFLKHPKSMQRNRLPTKCTTAYPAERSISQQSFEAGCDALFV